jgi:hypothetical protein
MHISAQHLAYSRRDRIIRSQIGLVGLWKHVMEKRHDSGATYLTNVKQGNDVFVGNHISVTQHMLSGLHMLCTHKMVARAAMMSEIKRDMIPDVEAELGLTNGKGGLGFFAKNC